METIEAAVAEGASGQQLARENRDINPKTTRN